MANLGFETIRLTNSEKQEVLNQSSPSRKGQLHICVCGSWGPREGRKLSQHDDGL